MHRYYVFERFGVIDHSCISNQVQKKENDCKSIECWIMHRYYVCELSDINDYSYKSNQVQILQLYPK